MTVYWADPHPPRPAATHPAHTARRHQEQLDALARVVARAQHDLAQSNVNARPPGAGRTSYPTRPDSAPGRRAA